MGETRRGLQWQKLGSLRAQETIRMLFGGERGLCPHCTAFVRFVQQGSMQAGHPDTGEVVGQSLTAVCPSCLNIVLFVTKDVGWTSWERYPAPQPIAIPGTPPRVAEAYREAQLALGSGAWHAAATMLRRAIASAATDFKVPESDEKRNYVGLAKRIEALKDRLLPATLEAAHLTKLLGDGGAHEEAEDRLLDELGPIDADSVGRAVEVAGYILSNLYDIPSKVAALRSPTQRESEGH